MVGAVAANFHTGSRSEILADYLFSSWGTVSPVRRQDDYGVDLYCTLTEREGARARVQDYYAVQVKSDLSPWQFVDSGAIEWLVEHPVPLFLACVDKPGGILSIYHVMARFAVWAASRKFEQLTLIPGVGDVGTAVQWDESGSFSLSAPIVRVTLSDVLDPEKLQTLGQVFRGWVRRDRENCDLVRASLTRYRMPLQYRTNEAPTPNDSVIESGNVFPGFPQMHRGIVAASEAAECIAGQLANEGDNRAPLWAVLFVHHLHQRYPEAFAGHVRWWSSLPSGLSSWVGHVLDPLAPAREGEDPHYLYKGIEALIGTLETVPELRRIFDRPTEKLQDAIMAALQARQPASPGGASSAR